MPATKIPTPQSLDLPGWTTPSLPHRRGPERSALPGASLAAAAARDSRECLPSILPDSIGSPSPRIARLRSVAPLSSEPSDKLRSPRCYLRAANPRGFCPLLLAEWRCFRNAATTLPARLL